MTQAWYADDATATGSLNDLLDWWKKLLTLGHMYGYHVNPSKTWLLTKEHCLSKAQDLFERFNHRRLTIAGFGGRISTVC